MIKLLLRIKWFKAAVIKAAFSDLYKDDANSAYLEYKFTDSTGKKYYRYLDDKYLPYTRWNQMHIRLLEIESRISRESLLAFSKELKKFAEAKDFINVARFVGELETRLELLYDPELIMRFLAGLYIREDQVKTSHIWNPDLEDEKFEQLMKDNEGGKLSFFFQKSNLTDHVTFLNTSTSGSENFWTEEIIQNQLKQTRLFNKMVKRSNSTSRVKSSPG